MSSFYLLYSLDLQSLASTPYLPHLIQYSLSEFIRCCTQIASLNLFSTSVKLLPPTFSSFTLSTQLSTPQKSITYYTFTTIVFLIE
jgi:hypothetical protein